MHLAGGCRRTELEKSCQSSHDPSLPERKKKNFLNLQAARSSSYTYMHPCFRSYVDVTRPGFVQPGYENRRRMRLAIYRYDWRAAGHPPPGEIPFNLRVFVDLLTSCKGGGVELPHGWIDGRDRLMLAFGLAGHVR